MKVLTAPNPILRTKTKPVKKITPEILHLAEEMVALTKTFTDPEGVGLSANQIGRNERFFIAKLYKTFNTYFNPRIINTSKTTKKYLEACLSIPNVYGEVIRPTQVDVEFQDKSGNKVVKKLKGVAGWIFQHETNHLDGKLFIDLTLEQKGRVYKVSGQDKTGAEILEEVELV